MEYKNTTSLIRLQLNEALNAVADVLTPAIITPEYLINRIPFLSEYRLATQTDKVIIFHKDKYNTNVERIVPNRGSIIFSNYNIFSDFYYYNDSKEERFFGKNIGLQLKSHAVIVPKEEEGEHELNILSRVLTIATEAAVYQTSVNYSETKGIKLKDNMTIDKTEFDNLINKINEAFFKLEELSKNLEFNL